MPKAHLCLLSTIFPTMEKISHACHGPRRVGLAAFAAHGHTGTWAHGQGKEVAFIHEDKDASDEWGVAQIYKLPGGCHK